MNPNDILALQDLIEKSFEQGSSTKTKEEPSSSSDITPASLVNVNVTTPIEKPKKKKPADPKDIWEPDEIPEVEDAYLENESDDRIKPDYDVLYLQNVAPEDLYLGMSGKTPSILSCENIVVRVMLPETRFVEISLELTAKYIDLRTPKYKLVLPYPQVIQPDKGQAKWDSVKESLDIILPLVDVDDGL